MRELQTQIMLVYQLLVYLLSRCSPNSLHRVASYLCLLPELPEGQDTTYEKEVLLELLVGYSLCCYEVDTRAFKFSQFGGMAASLKADTSICYPAPYYVDT